jgi:hypothetical protein
MNACREVQGQLARRPFRACASPILKISRTQGSTLVNPTWFPEDNPTFAVLQYDALTEDQLHAKVAQFLSGAQLRWQFWQPGQISPALSTAKQEAFDERMRAARPRSTASS